MSIFEQLVLANMTAYTLLIIVTISVVIRQTLETSLETQEDLGGYYFSGIIEQYGYKSEEHKVKTEDGYILTMFRMVPPKRCVGKVRKPPVLMMHGIFLAMDCWIAAGPQNGLAYLLTDLCFDLWLGNFRGNTYSRKHVNLNPDNDVDFWNFSYTEFGKYDIPAMMDYILKTTSLEKINYIGFSQGAGSFYIMCSERHEYCDKVDVMVSIAPATRLINMASPVYKSIVRFLVWSRDVVLEMTHGEIFKRGSTFEMIPSSICLHLTVICDILKDIAGSVNSTWRARFVSDATLKDASRIFPAGTSLINLIHMGQLIQSDSFKKYDYGIDKNIEIYGTSKPPNYDLSKVSTPVVVIYGLNDGLVDPKDVAWTVDQLPNVLEMYPVANKLWTHDDVICSKFIKKLLLPKVKQYLLKYSKV